MASVSPRPIRRRCTAPSRACDSTRRNASSSISGPTAKARRPASRRWSRAAASRRNPSTSPSASIRSARWRAAAARRAPWSAEAAALAKVASFLAAQGFAGPYLAADARAVHAAGGTPAQELGFALSAAVAYLRALADGGFSREAAAAAIGFRLAADADEFFTLAKFRALRLMWGRVRSACGLDAAPARVHGESAWRTMSARDPYVNVMRGATAAFAAGLGGADSVSVLPHTQALGLPDALARRLARNAQLILLEESHLGFVADPAAGAGVFEALTATLCEKGWAVFQALERAGGAPPALRAGSLPGRSRRGGRAHRRRRGAAESADDRRQRPSPISPKRRSTSCRRRRRPSTLSAKLSPRRSTALRLAEPFERLREISDAARKRDGARPKAFLAAIGPLSRHGRRVGFARDLFEAGGLETVADSGGDDPRGVGGALQGERRGGRVSVRRRRRLCRRAATRSRAR